MKRGDEEKILHPTFGKMHSSGLKKGSESAISLPNYTGFNYTDSPSSMSWSKAEIIGRGPSLSSNSVILGKTRGKVIATGKLATTDIMPRKEITQLRTLLAQLSLVTITSTYEILPPETFYPILLPIRSLLSMKLPMEVD